MILRIVTGDQGRAADWHEYTQQVFQVRGAVDLCGAIELIRYLLEIFLQKINVKNRGDRREDQAGKGVAHVQIGDRDKICDNDELIRDHHQGEKERKDQILPGEFQTREGQMPRV